jgi:hypothetical protein
MSRKRKHALSIHEGADLLGLRFPAFVAALEREVGQPLDVQFHRNRWTYLSCDAEAYEGRLCVRIHEAFVDAPPDVARAVASFIRRNDPQARRVIRKFINERSAELSAQSDRPARTARLQPSGEVYDLQEMFDDLNRHYFGGQCAAQITWGSGARTFRGRRHITFGSYDESTQMIRVHPALDRRSVPKYFVRYIVYHEMLHAVLPAPVSPSGKQLHHSRLFRQRERAFDDYERAMAWERRFVGEQTRPETRARRRPSARPADRTPLPADDLASLASLIARERRTAPSPEGGQ